MTLPITMASARGPAPLRGAALIRPSGTFSRKREKGCLTPARDRSAGRPQPLGCIADSTIADRIAHHPADAPFSQLGWEKVPEGRMRAGAAAPVRQMKRRASSRRTITRARRLRRSETPAEALLWSRLRARRLNGYKFVRQAPVGPFIADFLCRAARLVVEVDGATHSESHEAAYDARRTATLSADGHRVLRFQNDDVFHSIDAVLETILAAIEGRA